MPAAAQSGLMGRVTEAGTGAPVVGARVQANSGGRTVGVATTGETGDYRISNLTAGSYDVTITRIGYTLQRISGVQVGAGFATSNVTMNLIPSQLDQIVTTASRAPEKVIDAPASVFVLNAPEINDRPSVNIADHVVRLPGIDVARGGILQSNIVARGFNNIFSGALLTLTDNRFSFVPSLRVNIPYLTPTPSEDVERVEVVLGPGAALYGPNTASGVMHVITKSPFTSQGTTFTVDGGNQSLFRAGVRHAGAPNEKFGYKVSYDVFRATEWPEFQHDTLEKKARITDLRRQGGEARVDFRPTPASELIANVGMTRAGSAVEPTGLGPAQIKDWKYNTYQLRGRVNRLFAQVFLNQSDAGGTYLLRTVKPTTNCPNVADAACIIDKSQQLVAQAQHGWDFGARQKFLYGFDYIHTDPRTSGTINGRNEADDDITEVGGYLHSVTTLTPRLELTAAGRVDKHSRLEQSVFSPRIALVFKPVENQNLRLTYNRAFSTPSTNNLFLDLVAGAAGPYGVRALGVPTTGLSFKRDCAGGISSLCMRVPKAFGGTPENLVAANAAAMYKVAIGAASAGLVAAGIPQSIVSYMASLQPTSAQVSTQLRVLNTENATFRDVAATDLRDVQRIKPTIHNTLEAGYKGILGNRLQLSLDVWRDHRTNFVGPLIVETPNVFLDRASLQTYLVANLTPVVGAATAGVIGANTAAALGGISESKSTKGIPLGVVNFQEANSAVADIIVTYRNFGDLTVYGSDLGGELLLDGGFSVDGTYSWVNKDFFPRSEVGGVQDIALNAPATKGSLGLKFRDEAKGLSAEFRGRHVAEFPVFSFINGTIASYNLIDAGFAFRPASWRGVMVALNATNLLDKKHREFVGGGNLGRLVITRLQYTF
ncbi:MAG: TonB-dependent receptor [Gemmatimonadaceae bacterium]|nr:TonB-dependent receptor [Gemmatimonadaceae bacterium]